MSSLAASVECQKSESAAKSMDGKIGIDLDVAQNLLPPNELSKLRGKSNGRWLRLILNCPEDFLFCFSTANINGLTSSYGFNCRRFAQLTVCRGHEL